ncbi:TPA: hypothetical protein ACGA33_000855 [Clostridium perfringens]
MEEDLELFREHYLRNKSILDEKKYIIQTNTKLSMWIREFLSTISFIVVLIIAFFAIRFILTLIGYEENTNILSFLGGILTAKLTSKTSFSTIKLNNYRESKKNRPILELLSIDQLKLKEGSLGFLLKNKTSNLAKDVNIDLRFYGDSEYHNIIYKSNDNLKKYMIGFDSEFLIAISGLEEVNISFNNKIDSIYKRSSIKHKIILVNIDYSDIFDNKIKQAYAIGIDSNNSRYKIEFLENNYLNEYLIY